MRKFFWGAILGGGIMYWYLYYGGEWLQWGGQSAQRIGSQYRGDAVKRQADEALR